MNIDIFKITSNTFPIIFFDIILLFGVYCFPAISHVLPIPLYLFEPMRIILFSLLLFFPFAKKNAVIMAMTIPIFSYIFSDHPILPKAILMSAELTLNVSLFSWFSKKINIGVSVFVSVIISKCIYYLLKAALIYFGLLNMELAVTTFETQLILAAILGVVFQIAALYRKIDK